MRTGIKITSIVLTCIIFMSSNAQKTAFDFSFNHNALSVKDLQRSANFYKNVLGLQEITNRTESLGIKWFSLGEGKELHLISGNTDEVKINKAVHFALTTPNFDAFVKALDVAKVHYSDWPGTAGKINVRADGVRQVYIQDPDGYWIEVNSVAVK